MKTAQLYSLVFFVFFPFASYTAKDTISICDNHDTTQQTLAIIKPDAVSHCDTGQIISLIEKNQFTIVQMKKIKLTCKQAEGFYAEHKQKPFFKELVTFMTSGPVVIMVLKKEDAIKQWRELMGETNPEKARPGTMRKMFGSSITRNATHGSDKPETAKREINFFFS